MKNLSIRTRLAVTMVFLGLLLSLATGFGLYGMGIINASAQDVSHNSLPSVNALGKAEVMMARARLVLDRVALDPAAPNIKSLQQRAQNFLDDSDVMYKQYDVLARGADEDKLAEAAKLTRSQLRKVVESFNTAATGGDQAAIRRIAMETLPAAYGAMADASNKLKDFQITDASEQGVAKC